MSSQADGSGDQDAPYPPDDGQRGNSEMDSSPQIDVRFETASSSYDEEAVRRRKLGYGLNKKPGSLKDRLAAFQGKTEGDENNHNNAGGTEGGGSRRGSSRPGKLNVSMFDNKGANAPATDDELKVPKRRSAGKLAARMAMFQSSSEARKPVSKSYSRTSAKRVSGTEGKWPVKVSVVGRCDSSQNTSASLATSPDSRDVEAESTSTSATAVSSAPFPHQTKEEMQGGGQKTETFESVSTVKLPVQEGTQSERHTAESDSSLKQDGKGESSTEEDTLDPQCGISKSKFGNGPGSKPIRKAYYLSQSAGCKETGPKKTSGETEGGEASSEQISAEHALAARQDPEGKHSGLGGGGEGLITANIGVASLSAYCGTGKSAEDEQPSGSAVCEEEASQDNQMKSQLEEGNYAKSSDSTCPADDRIATVGEEKSGTDLAKRDAYQDDGILLECSDRSDENDAKTEYPSGAVDEERNQEEQAKSQLEKEGTKPSYTRDDETGGKEEETSNTVAAEDGSLQKAGFSIEYYEEPGRKNDEEGNRKNVREAEPPESVLGKNKACEEERMKSQPKEEKDLKPIGSLSCDGEMGGEKEISNPVLAEEDVQQKAKACQEVAERGNVAREERFATKESESTGLAEESRLEKQRLAAEQAELQRLERERRIAEKEASFRIMEDERIRDEEMLAALEERRLMEHEAHGSYAKFTPIVDDAAPQRDLTPDEMESLHAILKTQVENRPMYNVLNDEQDAEDLLDYTLDMVGDRATVGHVVDEVAFLGFKCFTEEVQERFGRCLTKFFGNMP